MALFSSQSEKQQTQRDDQQKSPQINPDVLVNLNLTQADIDSHYKNQQLENNKKEVVEQANSYYQEASSGQISFSEPKLIKLGEIALQPKVENLTQIPDSLTAQFKEIEGAMHPEDRTNIKIYLDTFNSNFGQKALDAKDWKTAINAFDLATVGGIIQKPDVIKQLGEIYSNDTETRREIAEAIQKRIELQKPSAAQAPVPSILVKTEAPTPNLTDKIAKTTEAFPSPTTPQTMPLPQNIIPFNRMAAAKAETLTQPVGAPTTPILGETTLQPDLRAAPPNPSPVPTPFSKAA